MYNILSYTNVHSLALVSYLIAQCTIVYHLKLNSDIFGFSLNTLCRPKCYQQNIHLNFNMFHLPCINQIQNKQITNKRTSIFMIYFIHNVLPNMFRPVIRPSSERYYYKNAKRTNVVNCFIIAPVSTPHHQNAALKLSTSLDQTSLCTDQKILNPKILIILQLNLSYIIIIILTEIIIVIMY